MIYTDSTRSFVVNVPPLCLCSGCFLAQLIKGGSELITELPSRKTTGPGLSWSGDIRLPYCNRHVGNAGRQLTLRKNLDRSTPSQTGGSNLRKRQLEGNRKILSREETFGRPHKEEVIPPSKPNTVAHASTLNGNNVWFTSTAIWVSFVIEVESSVPWWPPTKFPGNGQVVDPAIAATSWSSSRDGECYVIKNSIRFKNLTSSYGEYVRQLLLDKLSLVDRAWAVGKPLNHSTPKTPYYHTTRIHTTILPDLVLTKY